MATDAITSEADLLGQVIELAEEYFGWRCVHFRPAKTKHGWRTPVQGSMGKGWPDVVMVNGGRILAAELKAAKGQPTKEQVEVLALLAKAGVETHIWRPADFDDIVDTLRRRA